MKIYNIDKHSHGKMIVKNNSQENLSIINI